MGSSPLTRGKPRRASPTASCTGLIPAHAGKTCRRLRSSPHGRAHPRSRGENASVSHRYCVARGSSPLTRGKHAVLVRHVEARGLIPAHAGKTYRLASILEENRAHPRSRGENGRIQPGAPAARGSSPLTRGKRRIALLDELAAGLIPAHAGKTARTAASSGMPAAHPRSRGENQARQTGSLRSSGSSPLTRGKRATGASWPPAFGLIPAHAGKTCPGCRSTKRTSGSSPLTRGKPSAARLWESRSGLIPAHAGKTSRSPQTSVRVTAHPRSRGENTLHGLASMRPAGSSPLTRGKRSCGRQGSEHLRLIPAHAGKTSRRSALLWLRAAHPRSRGENRAGEG